MKFSPNPEWKETGGWLEVARRGTDDYADRLFGHVVDDVTAKTIGRQATVLVGEPFDDSRPGPSHTAGPVAIRQALAQTQAFHLEAGPIDVPGDVGDVDDLLSIADHDIGYVEPIDRVQNRLRKTTAWIYDQDVVPIFLGGDGSLTYPNVVPLCERGSVGCLHFDGTLDVRERDEPAADTGSRQLLAEGLDAYACIGARAIDSAPAHRKFVAEHGGTVITAARAGRKPHTAVERALETFGDLDSVYVSVDLSVVAGVGNTDTPSGLSARELFSALEAVGRETQITGLEVVGCTDSVDDWGRQSAIGAMAIAHLLARLNP